MQDELYTFLHLKLGIAQPASRLISLLVLCFFFFPDQTLSPLQVTSVKEGNTKGVPKNSIQHSTFEEKNTTIFAHWIEQSGEYEGLQAFTL